MSILFKGNLEEGNYTLIKTTDGWVLKGKTSYVGFNFADRPQGWIPCSERLPKIGEYHISEPCLVYCKGGVYAFAELEENIFGQVGWNCERDDDYHEPIGEVIAWMPLPKPWKGASR